MADTRKDRRAPIALKVRFKSATIDEFIEQYSVDISRGGIFIKSKTPMSVGTLLKFEFQLKDHSSLIHGVGRVVWNREASANSPPGMGIKFIKMDPESRALVDRMVQSRGEGPGRFEQGQTEGNAEESFFPAGSPSLPSPEDRTQVRHASEFLAAAAAEGDATHAKEEAERRAAEARRRGELLDRQRDTKRRPRLKKTLVGVGSEDQEATMPRAEAAVSPLESTETLIAATAVSGAAAAPTANPYASEPVSGAVPAGTPISGPVEAAAVSTAEESAAQPSATEASSSSSAGLAAPGETLDGEPTKIRVRPSFPDEEATEKSRPRAALPMPEAQAPDASESSKAGRTGMIAFVAILLGAIGVVAYLQLRPEEGAESGTQNARAEGEAESEPPTPDPDEQAPEAEENDELAATDPVEPTDESENEEVPVEVPTVSVRVVSTPSGAAIAIDGEAQGAAPITVGLPIGQSAHLTATLEGYLPSAMDVTATERQRPITLRLEQMPYVISVSSNPSGATVRAAGETVTTPAEIVLARAPRRAVDLTATQSGFRTARASVPLSEFREIGGRMVAAAAITLSRRPRSSGPSQRETDSEPASPAQGSESGSGASSESASSGESGSESAATDEESQASSGSESEGTDSGGSSGGAGDSSSAAEESPGGGNSGGASGGGDDDTPPNPFGD